jgi:hypothetical protein
MKTSFQIPISDDLRATMDDVAGKIKEALAATGERWHFALLLFHEDTNKTAYISDIERKGAVDAFRKAVELIANPDVKREELMSPRDAIRFFGERGTVAAMSWLDRKPADSALLSACQAAVDAGATPHEAAIALASLETYWLVKGT